MATKSTRKRKPGLKYPIGTLISIKNREAVSKGSSIEDLNESIEAIVIDNEANAPSEESYSSATALYFRKKYNKKSKRSTYTPVTVMFDADPTNDYAFEVTKLTGTKNPGLNRYHSWVAENSGNDSRGRYFELGCQRIHLRDVVGYLRLTGQHISNVGKGKIFGAEDVFKAFQRFHTKG